MKDRRCDIASFPRTDLELSEVCFGSMRFVPADSSVGQWDDGFRALDAAIDAGVNVIHSSEQYNTFHALSAFLADHPRSGDLHHIVKVHAPEYDETEFDAAKLRAEIERLLTALNTEHIAVVQHLQRGPNCPKEDAYDESGDRHRIPAVAATTEPLMELAADLKKEGKIATLATFPHTVGFARAALDVGDFDGMVHFFDVLETEMHAFFGELRARDMGFIAIRPLLQGMLTDGRADRANLSPEDPKRGANWDPWYALREEIEDVIGGAPQSWTDYALRFALAPSAVSTAVVSLNTEQQVERAVAACDGHYPSEGEVAAVDAAIARAGPIPKRTIL